MEQKHFTAIVIGDNHQEIMEKYDSNLKITPYVAMQFKDSKELYETEIMFLETLLANNSDALSEDGKDWIKFELETLKKTDHIDYYISKADRMGYTIDQETGNAFCDKNPNGYYDYCRIGKDLSLPLITFNDEEVYSARKKDIDFSKLADKKRLFKKLGDEFGVFRKYDNSDIKLSFSFSKGGMGESADKQRSGFMRLAKLLTCMEQVIDNAVGIEVHNRNQEGYKVDDSLKNMYVLASAFVDGENIVPVKLEVKEFSDKKYSLRRNCVREHKNERDR